MKVLLIAVAALCAAGCHSSSSPSASATLDPPANPNPDLDLDTFPASVDCNDNDAAIWRTVNVFADTDRDGIGAGQEVVRCAGNATPAGFSTASTDCAAADSAIHTLMAYAARDADGDRVQLASAGTLCGDGTTLPAGYFANAGATPDDCNDQSASIWQVESFREDFDRDGVGHGPLVAVCSGGGAPPGFAVSSTDCDPLDTTKWRLVASYRDVDGDGVGSGSMIPLCVGSGPAPFGSSFLGFDPLDTETDPNSTLVSDFDLNMPSLFIESEADDDDFL